VVGQTTRGGKSDRVLDWKGVTEEGREIGSGEGLFSLLAKGPRWPGLAMVTKNASNVGQGGGGPEKKGQKTRPLPKESSFPEVRETRHDPTVNRARGNPQGIQSHANPKEKGFRKASGPRSQRESLERQPQYKRGKKTALDGVGGNGVEDQPGKLTNNRD